MVEMTRFACNQCGASYDSENALRDHQRTTHRKVSSNSTEEYVPVSGSSDPATKQDDKKKPLLDDWGKSDKH